ncbi:MAG: CocE/NonD family hydrolase, partial [Acidobacteriaceae bacterium]|nr:CocE/NonD family hydrolase [Acidobacteriaceae bacterium]
MMRAVIFLSAAAILLVTAVRGEQARKGDARPEARDDLQGVLIPMRDGVQLEADIFLPKGNARWPAVLVRTPYNRKSAASASYRYFVLRGYAVVLQDVRGKYGSQGAFESAKQEGPDGSDTISWIAQQRWSNGRVVMAGSSYLGLAQWWAALEDNP